MFQLAVVAIGIAVSGLFRGGMAISVAAYGDPPWPRFVHEVTPSAVLRSPAIGVIDSDMVALSAGKMRSFSRSGTTFVEAALLGTGDVDPVTKVDDDPNPKGFPEYTFPLIEIRGEYVRVMVHARKGVLAWLKLAPRHRAVCRWDQDVRHNDFCADVFFGGRTSLETYPRPRETTRPERVTRDDLNRRRIDTVYVVETRRGWARLVGYGSSGSSLKVSLGWMRIRGLDWNLRIWPFCEAD